MRNFSSSYLVPLAGSSGGAKGRGGDHELSREVGEELREKGTNPTTSLQKHYLELHEKYLKDAKEIMDEKDFSQASEKYWGAVAELIKAVAAEEGRELKHHAEIAEYVGDLALSRQDPEILDLFDSAQGLHWNFYENRFRKEMLERRIERVLKLIEKLK